MPLKSINQFLLVFTLLSSTLWSANDQANVYKFKHSIDNISAEWHSFYIPDSIYGSLNINLSDLRIVGLKGGDTSLVPFIIKSTAPLYKTLKKPLVQINESTRNGAKYITFKTLPEPISQIELQVSETDFDWKVNLEGSHDQKKWFSILNNYRIAGFSNNEVDFKYTALNFTTSNYEFYRLKIPQKNMQAEISASVAEFIQTPGILQKHSILSQTVTQSKSNTIIEVTLPYATPVDQIFIPVQATSDYHRPITIEYAADSFQVNQQWVYHYNHATSAIINSIQPNNLAVGIPLAKYIKITVQNFDNAPLRFQSLHLSSYRTQIIAHFTNPNTKGVKFELIYGNPSAQAPQFDLTHFQNSIPLDAPPLQLGPQIALQAPQALVSPFVSNQYWLWAVLFIVSALMIYFTVQMLRKKEEN